MGGWLQGGDRAADDRGEVRAAVDPGGGVRRQPCAAHAHQRRHQRPPGTYSFLPFLNINIFSKQPFGKCQTTLPFLDLQPLVFRYKLTLHFFFLFKVLWGSFFKETILIYYKFFLT